MAEEDTLPQDPFARSIAEEQAAQQALLKRYQQLQSGLERRVSMPFDPTLMRISQALLSPTQSGSFGESLGKGVGALVEGSEAEAARQQAIMKMQAELEEKMLGIKQKGSQLQAIAQMAGYPGARPAAAGQPVAPTAGQPAAQPTGQPAAQAPSTGGGSVFDSALEQYGIQIMEGDPDYLKTPQELVAELWTSGVRDPKEIREQIRKFKKDRYEINQTGVVDRATGKSIVFPSGKTVEYPLSDESGNYLGKFEIDSSYAAALSNLQPGTPAYNALSRRARGMAPAQAPAAPGGIPGVAPEAAPEEAPEAVPEAPTRVAAQGMPTVSEAAARAEGAKEEARETAKTAAQAFSASRTAFLESPTLMRAAENMNSLVNTNPDAFRIMSKPGIAQAVMRAANKGLQIGNFGSISVPTDELSAYKLNQKELDTLNLFANQLALAKNANRKMSRILGEGAMSDFESNMANQMLELNNASPEAIKFINEFTMLRARNAELRHQTLVELKKRGMSTDDALASKEMADLNQGYDSALRSLAERNAGLLGQKKTMRGTIKATDSDVPPGYIRDPKTRVIRKKREGE